VQYFFSEINFIIGFIPNFAEITKPIPNLQNKNQEFKWDDETKNAFRKIKEVIVLALVLVSLDYSKGFYIFSFTS
jgi:hypothetical protein